MTRKPRTDTDPAFRASHLLLGAASLLVVVGLLYIAFSAPRGLPGSHHYNLTVQMTNLANLPERGADVRIAGRLVGTQSGAGFEHGTPTIRLRLDPDVGPLPQDTRVRVRLRSLLGSQYVELIPGVSNHKLPSGSTIPATQTSAMVQLPDVLDSLDGTRRAALGTAIRGLGTGLAGRGAGLNGVLKQAPQALESFHSVMQLVPPGRISRLVRSADSFTFAVSAVRVQLARSLTAFAAAAAPFADEHKAVTRALEVAPSSLLGVHRSLAVIDPVLDHATRFARAATAFTAVAPKALTGLHSLLTGGRMPLGDLRRVLREAQAAVPTTLAATDALQPSLNPLRQTLLEARSPVRIVGNYGCDVENFARNWASFSGNGGVGQDGPLGPPTSLRLVLGDLFPRVSGASAPLTRGIDAYPAPCQASKDGSR